MTRGKKSVTGENITKELCVRACAACVHVCVYMCVRVSTWKSCLGWKMVYEEPKVAYS